MQLPERGGAMGQRAAVSATGAILVPFARGVLLALLVLLVGTGVASGATLNGYRASVAVSQTGIGSAGVPVPVGFSTRLTVTPAAETNPDPLTVMDLTLDDVRVTPGGFPVCSAAAITAAGEDSGCPHGALVGRGEIAGALWNPSQPTVAGLTCEAILDVWNAGSGHLTYFLRVLSGHFCDGLQTGEIPAWTALMRQSGPNLTIAMTLPAEDSIDIGDTGLFSGLSSLSVDFIRLSHAVGHRSVPFFGSIGCPGGRRGYSLSLRADGIDAGQRATLAGSSGC